MKTFKKDSFEYLAEKILGKGFPPHLAGTLLFKDLLPDAQAVIVRALGWMKRSGYSLTHFNPVLIRWLALTVPNILPSACGGKIPPITVPGRHQKLDDYVARQASPSGNGRDVFVDLGCGFPPVTTVDTAHRFPDWQILGVDLSFAEYILYDSMGQYACFNQEGDLQYFQPSVPLAQKSLYSDLEPAKLKLCQLFDELHPLIQNRDAHTLKTAEKDGNRLIRTHISDFETENLKFLISDLRELPPLDATVARCMNLFFYFTPEKRKTMVGCIKEHLRNNGLLITGTNSFGIQTRYFVYRKESRDLVLREFAFSLDNLGHISIMPWFTIHEDDPEAFLLAELSSAIRSSPPFWEEFSKAQDHFLEHLGICSRETEGFLHFPEKIMPPDTFLKQNALLWQEMQTRGYLEGVVDVLAGAGYDAWINPADDIAVRPPGN